MATTSHMGREEFGWHDESNSVRAEVREEECQTLQEDKLSHMSCISICQSIEHTSQNCHEHCHQCEPHAHEFEPPHSVNKEHCEPLTRNHRCN